MKHWRKQLQNFVKYKQMKNLRITFVQSPLFWEAPEKNRAHFDKLLARLYKSSTDVILLPEMFTTGFTMNAGSVSETMKGHSVEWMHKVAMGKNAVVCGSLVIRDRGRYYNRFIWMQPDGKHFHYDKRHLFRMAREHNTYSPGTKRLIVEWRGWRICPLVCYDLRFPVWSRNRDEFDLLIYVANWPEKRRFAWSQLLIARAIENQCYVAGLNRVGVDGKGIPYTGDSVVLDPVGMKISSTKPSKTSVETVVLSMRKLEDLRKQFPVMMDADKFMIRE
jgi:omega-amidase